MYRVQQAGEKQWKDFDELFDCIHLVIAYEKEKKASRDQAHPHKPVLEEFEEAVTTRPFTAGEVKSLVFM